MKKVLFFRRIKIKPDKLLFLVWNKSKTKSLFKKLSHANKENEGFFAICIQKRLP